MAYTRQPNTTKAGRGLKQNPTPSPLSPSGALPVVLDAEIATTSTLGMVIIGNGINVTPEGVISVNTSSSTSSCRCTSISITGNYTATLENYYIGAKLTAPATLTLPLDPPDCIEYIIKLEFGPPVGTRKLTIVSSGANKIDDSSSIILTTPYQSVNLISHGTDWYLI